MSETETRRAIRQLIEYYNRTLGEGETKTIILADLYLKLGNEPEGRRHLKNAADTLRRSGQTDRALVFLRSTPGVYSGPGPDPKSEAEDYLDSALGKIASGKHLMTIPEQVTLLSQAEKAAKRFQRWDYLPRIKLALAYELQAAGQNQKAFRYLNDFWKLAEKVGEARMLKIATLMMAEFLHWKGKFAEAVRRYEEVVEDLEEFSDDEATLKATARVGLCYVRCGRIPRGMGMIDTVRAKADLLHLPQIAIFADLMALIALFELRKTAEAEAVLDRLSGSSSGPGGALYPLAGGGLQGLYPLHGGRL